MTDLLQHGTVEDARNAHFEALRDAMRSGHWMATIWDVRDGRIRLIRRTTWQFPTGDFEAAIQQLKEACQDDYGRPVIPDPLPFAVLDGINEDLQAFTDEEGNGEERCDD